MHSLADLIAFNEREKAREMPFFGQELFLRAQKKGPLTSPAYRPRRRSAARWRARRASTRASTQHRLDAIVAPTGSPAWTTDLVNGDHFTGASSTPAAVAGYPSITVPAGQAFGLPVGISFIGGAWSEAKLIALAYAYEQATKHRRPPGFCPLRPLIRFGSPCSISEQCVATSYCATRCSVIKGLQAHAVFHSCTSDYS